MGIIFGIVTYRYYSAPDISPDMQKIYKAINLTELPYEVKSNIMKYEGEKQSVRKSSTHLFSNGSSGNVTVTEVGIVNTEKEKIIQSTLSWVDYTRKFTSVITNLDTNYLIANPQFMGVEILIDKTIDAISIVDFILGKTPNEENEKATKILQPFENNETVSVAYTVSVYSGYYDKNGKLKINQNILPEKYILGVKQK